MARRYGKDNETLGGKVGPKIAQMVAETMTHHLRQSQNHRSEIGAQAALKFFKTLEVERDTHLKDILGLLLGHDKTHPAMEKMLRFMHGGHGELAQLLVHSTLSGAAATGIGSGLANILAPANQAIMYADPAQILEPSAIAQMVAARLVSADYAREIAKMSGYPGEATDLMIAGSYSWPSISELLTLLRRGQNNGEEVVTALRRSGVPEQFIAGLLSLREEILSPPEAALAVLRTIISEDEGRAIAARSGYSAHDFDIMVWNTGEPPGLMQLLEAYRREFIDDARLRKGIAQSRVRDEWADVVEKLRFSRASPSDALRGVIQGHISNDEGKKIAQEGGLALEDWEWLRETEGNPAAPMEMISLWRRGKTSKGKVEQAIREGRVKNKYIPELLSLKRAIPSIYQVKAMLTAGSISGVEGARLLHELGYESDVVGAFVHAATSGQVVKEKQLAKGEVEELFYEHAIDEAQALGLLKALGYHEQNAKLLLLIVNLKREKALRQAAMSPIRTAYIHRHINASEASKQLDALGVPHAQRDFALSVWQTDRTATTRTLTEAQIVKANERGLLDDMTAEQRLLDLGYTRTDARILLDLEKDRATPAP